MLKRFVNTLKYIFFTAVLCIYMTACGNADKQSAAEHEPEEETYTVEEWQNAAGVFMTLTDAKFWLGTKAKDYTLYYSMSDLTGDGTEELIIGIQGEEGIALCFLYTRDGERIHITDSRTESDLVNIPTILYENEHLVA